MPERDDDAVDQYGASIGDKYGYGDERMYRLAEEDARMYIAKLFKLGITIIAMVVLFYLGYELGLRR